MYAGNTNWSERMGKLSKYESRLPDANGMVRYSDTANPIWAEM